MAEAATDASGAGAEVKRKPLTHWIMAIYAAPGLPLALVGLPMAVYLPAVYTGRDGYALDMVLVAAVLFFSRFSDVITDPIIGFISDRTRTRWGRRKPYIFIGTPIYAAGIYMLFIGAPVDVLPSDLAGAVAGDTILRFRDMDLFGYTFSVGYPYLFGALTLIYLGSTIKDLPYRAWAAELSSDYNERTKITSWREGFGVTGALMSAFTPGIIFFLGYTRPIDAVFYLSVTMLIIMPILTFTALGVVPEWPVRERVTKRMPLVASIKMVLQNRIYVRYIFIFTFSGIGSAMTNALSFFFVQHVLMAGALYGFYLAPYFISQIVSIPIWFKLSTKIGKHRATMAAIGWYAFWASWLPLIAISPIEWYQGWRIENLIGWLPADTFRTIMDYFTNSVTGEVIETGKFLFFVVIMMLKGSAIGALAALPQSMAADIIDVDTMTTGQQRAGAYFAIGGMIGKFAGMFGTSFGLAAAVYFGFDQLADPMNTTNTTESLFWLACLYSVIPALFKFGAMPFLWTWPLTESRLIEIQAEIHAANLASAEDEIVDAVEEGNAPA